MGNTWNNVKTVFLLVLLSGIFILIGQFVLPGLTGLILAMIGCSARLSGD